MKILHIFDHSLPLHSGYTFRSFSILSEQKALGFEVFPLTTSKQGKGDALFEEAEGLRFYRTPNQGNLSFLCQMKATATRLDALVRELKPDVLHAHSPILNALPALWVGRKHKLPVVYEVRAFWEDAAVDHGSTQEGSLRYRLTKALETFALKRATQVTTICEGLRLDIVSRGIPSERVTVIPNAVNAEKFQFNTPSDEVLRAKLGLEGATVLGFAGSFYAYEGLDLLLEAAALLLPKHPELYVLMVGGGPQDAALKELTEKLGLTERVIFTGRVPHSEVQHYYNLIDILAYPRKPMRLTELVTPLKPLEAMAQGRMFVASNVGGHRELIRHGETGFLFEAGNPQALADEVETLLSRRAEWEKLKQQARQFVETERTWKLSVSRYQTVYANALKAFGRTA